MEEGGDCRPVRIGRGQKMNNERVDGERWMKLRNVTGHLACYMSVTRRDRKMKKENRIMIGRRE